jgi:hypothetical protein
VKQTYIITIDLGGEDSVYFTEMTSQQAEKMRQLIRQSGEKFSVTPIRKADGFNSYDDLMENFEDFVDVRFK